MQDGGRCGNVAAICAGGSGGLAAACQEDDAQTSSGQLVQIRWDPVRQRQRRQVSGRCCCLLSMLSSMVAEELCSIIILNNSASYDWRPVSDVIAWRFLKTSHQKNGKKTFILELVSYRITNIQKHTNKKTDRIKRAHLTYFMSPEFASICVCITCNNLCKKVFYLLKSVGILKAAAGRICIHKNLSRNTGNLKRKWQNIL